jgi:hypothetical protein
MDMEDDMMMIVVVLVSWVAQILMWPCLSSLYLLHAGNTVFCRLMVGRRIPTTPIHSHTQRRWVDEILLV